LIEIRKMTVIDAAIASTILQTSIAELCEDDHHNDPDLVSQWLGNKTQSDIAAWIGDPKAELFVAMIQGMSAGVGGFIKNGTITLNYVAPAHRFCGVSHALLDHMERRLCVLGVKEAKLTSTKTAHRFYLGAGWLDVRRARTGRAVSGFPMKKLLAPRGTHP